MPELRDATPSPARHDRHGSCSCRSAFDVRTAAHVGVCNIKLSAARERDGSRVRRHDRKCQDAYDFFASCHSGRCPFRSRGSRVSWASSVHRILAAAAHRPPYRVLLRCSAEHNNEQTSSSQLQPRSASIVAPSAPTITLRSGQSYGTAPQVSNVRAQ